MRRRSMLASSAALLAWPAVPSVAAETATFGLVGETPIDEARDAVLGQNGGTAYVAANDGFVTVDVTEPTTPTKLAERRNITPDGRAETLEGIWDLAVDGDRLVVAGPASGRNPGLAGFLLYDVADPATPEQLAFFETAYPIHNIAFDEGIAYLTGNNQVGNPLIAVDCTDDDPREVGRWSLPDHDDAWNDVEPFVRTLHDVYVQNGMAYLAYWDAGTWTVDVNDPSEMSFVSRVRGRSIETLESQSRTNNDYGELPGNDHYVAVDEDASLLAIGAEAWDNPNSDTVGGPGGLELYDISTPTDPQQVASIDAPETPDATYAGTWTTSHNFDFAGDRLYTSWYQGGLTVHDVSEPSNPTELGAWEDRDRLMFFTAQVDPDERFVVASSIGHPANPVDIETGLYVFPALDENGEPTISGGTGPTEPTTTTTMTTTSSPTTTSPTTTTATRTTMAPTTEPMTDPSTTEEATTTGPDSGSGSGPGFGLLSALAGLSAAALGLKRRRNDE